MNRGWVGVTILAAWLSLAGCGSKYPQFERADDLAQTLKDRGVIWETSTRMSFQGMKHARIDEGIALDGDGLRVEILRITDHRTYKIMSSAAALMGLMGSVMEEKADQPPDLYRSEPFIIVIRKEPEPGQVVSILESILPRDE